LSAGFVRIAGVDEVGRGALAGPLVAAAVVLAEPVPGLDDSKRLSARQRAAAFADLRSGAHAIGIGVVDRETVDRYGVQTANYAAMAQAVAQLSPPPDFLLVDGFEVPGIPVPQKRLIKGDRQSASIAAASIVAKVMRDEMMTALSDRYPEYGFAEHKGYGTKAHLSALARLGPCPAHRTSFAPLVAPLESGDLFEGIRGEGLG